MHILTKPELAALQHLAATLTKTHAPPETMKQLAEAVPSLLATLDRYTRAASWGAL